MIKKPETNNLKDWHRYFAVSCNNRAWELAVKERTKEEDEELLNVAHASAQHWGQVGTELNIMRAKMLLAEVHALLGLGDSSLRMAREIKTYFLKADTPDWELAYVHTINAHAAKVAGDDSFESAYMDAEATIEAIKDPEDRAVVLQTFELI
ncbi:hypothetical protein ACWJJH_02265 [Endozoicomonadaceae bacterium StTr2]